MADLNVVQRCHHPFCSTTSLSLKRARRVLAATLSTPLGLYSPGIAPLHSMSRVHHHAIRNFCLTASNQDHITQWTETGQTQRHAHTDTHTLTHPPPPDEPNEVRMREHRNCPVQYPHSARHWEAPPLESLQHRAQEGVVLEATRRHQHLWRSLVPDPTNLVGACQAVAASQVAAEGVHAANPSDGRY